MVYRLADPAGEHIVEAASDFLPPTPVQQLTNYRLLVGAPPPPPPPPPMQMRRRRSPEEKRSLLRRHANENQNWDSLVPPPPPPIKDPPLVGDWKGGGDFVAPTPRSSSPPLPPIRDIRQVLNGEHSRLGSSSEESLSKIMDQASHSSRSLNQLLDERSTVSEEDNDDYDVKVASEEQDRYQTSEEETPLPESLPKVISPRVLSPRVAQPQQQPPPPPPVVSQPVSPPKPVKLKSPPKPAVSKYQQIVAKKLAEQQESRSMTRRVRRGRSKTPERRRSRSRSRTTTTKTPQNQRKRGFFRNIFAKKKADDFTSVISDRSQSLKSHNKPPAKNRIDGDRKELSSLNTLSSSKTAHFGTQVDSDRAFYANDEVSMLTNPTLDAPSIGVLGTQISVDHRVIPHGKSSESSDPVGQYYEQRNDTNMEHFAEPDGASPRSRSPEKNIRVAVPDVKELPLAAPMDPNVFVPDPPLKLIISDDSEESAPIPSMVLPDKKEDEQSVPLPYSMSAAVAMNAKAVAYLHKLNGDPSPRNLWKEASIDTSPRLALQQKPKVETHVFAPEFDQETLSAETTRETLEVVRTLEVINSKPLESPIVDYAASKGLELFKQQREMDISTGRSHRVSPSKALKIIEPIDPAEEVEPTDPIQRAGRRLLSKSAIPIQAAARRYLAQREAVDRMWALIEIQSYLRRWRAEAAFFASIVAVVSVQAVIRGTLVRKRITKSSLAATQVQKTIRGFLAITNTYTKIYQIIVVQAQARAWSAKRRVNGYRAILQAQAEKEAALKLQTWWRSRSANILYRFLVYDTTVAQSMARAFLARKKVKSLREARRHRCAMNIQRVWRGRKDYRIYNRYRSATAIQCTWRTFQAVIILRRHKAAIKIQASWRGFQTYTDYIFFLVDVLLVQRRARMWLAKRQLQQKKLDVAATKIQTMWRCRSLARPFRRFVASKKIQSVWRGHQAAVNLTQYVAARSVQRMWRGRQVFRSYKMNRAATMIQKEWRGFKAYTDYIFDLSDIIRVQGAMRIWLARKRVNARIRNMAATKIQSFWRCNSIRIGYEMLMASIKIQKYWRRHSAFMNYIVAIASVVSIQAVARSFIARYRVKLMKSENAVASIQKQWKRHRTGIRANSIRVSGVTDIQFRSKALGKSGAPSPWRRTSPTAGFPVLVNRVTKLQAYVRMQLAKRDYHLHLGCAIIIQAAARRYIVVKNAKEAALQSRKNKLHVLSKMSQWTMLEPAASTDEQAACEKIQFWWRIVQECREEKKAALTIERFFLRIKLDIEEEIRRSQERKARRQHEKNRMTRNQRRQQSKGSGKLVEHDDSQSDLFNFPSSSGSDIFNFSPKHADKLKRKNGSGSTPKQFSFDAPSPKALISPPSSTVPSKTKSSRKSGMKSPPYRSQSPGGTSVQSRRSEKIRQRTKHRDSSPSMNLAGRHELERPATSHRRPTSTKSSVEGVRPSRSVSSNRSGRRSASSSRSKSQSRQRPSIESRRPTSTKSAFESSNRKISDAKRVLEQHKKSAAPRQPPTSTKSSFESNRFFGPSSEKPNRMSLDGKRRPLSTRSSFESGRVVEAKRLLAQHQQGQETDRPRPRPTLDSPSSVLSRAKAITKRSSSVQDAFVHTHRESPRLGNVKFLSSPVSLKLEDADEETLLEEGFGMI